MKINSHELDRHITGNFGEDAFIQDEDDDVCPHCAQVYRVIGGGEGVVYVVCAHASDCPVTPEENAMAERRLRGA